MANRRYNQFYYTGHNYPVQLDCQWTVDATNANGVTGLVGAGIQDVWMHTSTTPAVGNPNPAVGYAIIQLQDNFKGYYFGGAQVQSPLSGAEISISGSSVLTVGEVYVITTVGTSTAANWQAVGLPVGITPAVGVPFVATATGSGTGTGKVKINAVAGSGIGLVDVLGNPATTISSSAAMVPGISSSAYMILRFLAPNFTGSALAAHSHALLLKNAAVADGATTRVNAGTNLLGANTGSDITVAGGGANGGVQTASAGTPAGTVSWVAAAPAAGSVVRANFLFSNSRILNQGS